MVTPRIYYPDSPQQSPDQPALPGQPPYPETPIPGQPPGTAIPGQPPLPGTPNPPGRPPAPGEPETPGDPPIPGRLPYPETPLPDQPPLPGSPEQPGSPAARPPPDLLLTVTALRRVTASCDGHQDRLGRDRHRAVLLVRCQFLLRSLLRLFHHHGLHHGLRIAAAQFAPGRRANGLEHAR